MLIQGWFYFTTCCRDGSHCISAFLRDWISYLFCFIYSFWYLDVSNLIQDLCGRALKMFITSLQFQQLYRQLLPVRLWQNNSHDYFGQYFNQQLFNTITHRLWKFNLIRDLTEKHIINKCLIISIKYYNNIRLPIQHVHYNVISIWHIKCDKRLQKYDFLGVLSNISVT